MDGFRIEILVERADQIKGLVIEKKLAVAGHKIAKPEAHGLAISDRALQGNFQGINVGFGGAPESRIFDRAAKSLFGSDDRRNAVLKHQPVAAIVNAELD